MTSIKLGDLVSLKNHPFIQGATNVKISAFAQMTPPILVVSELFKSSTAYEKDSGIKKPRLVRCIFYSHRTHKFESHWFNIDHLKLIDQVNNSTESVPEPKRKVKLKEEKVLNADSNSVNIEQQYPKETSIETLKATFLNSQVILKSCDYELGKQKITFIKNDNKASQKTTSHLDFLPPVLTVIDIKTSDEKVIYDSKTGGQNKYFSHFVLKCKYYNPSTGSFTEDFLPIETLNLVPKIESLDLIESYIKERKFIRQKLENEIVLECGVVLEHSYFQPLDILFNHYKYKLKYFDFFRTQYLEIDLSKINLNTDIIELDDLVISKIPEYKTAIQDFSSVKDFVFEVNKYYRITYEDMQSRITKRVIFVKEYVKGKIVIADCLLRDGAERHFRIKDGILKIEELNSSYF